MAPAFQRPRKVPSRQTFSERQRQHGVLDRALALVSSAAGAILGWLAIALFVVVGAANTASCFVSPPRTEASSVDTDAVATFQLRHVNPRDSLDRLLAHEVLDGWTRIGQSAAILELRIVDSEEINAASFGNGRFAIWRGLRRVPQADRYAIYAHEFAHDQLHHGGKAGNMADVTDWLGEALATLGGADEQTSATLKHWTDQLVMPQYSRRQELDADREGVALLGRMGFAAPDSMMCHALRAVAAAADVPDGGMFASHPSMQQRITSAANGGGC